jgi:Amt family ammonium transporter
LLGKQAIAVGATLVGSFVISFILAKVIVATIGFRVSADDEATGLDLTQHAETAYSLGDLSIGRHG